MNAKFKTLVSEATGLLKQSPLILLLALTGAISAVVAIEYEREPWAFSLTLLALVACLGISLFFALKMLASRSGNKILYSCLGLVALGLLYAFLPKTQENFTEPYGYFLAALVVLSHLLVSFIAYLKKDHSKSFWYYNKQLFLNLFQTGIFTFVLVGGVMLAILSVDKLFELEFNGELYPQTLLFLAISGSTFIFLLFSGKGLSDLEKPTSYPAVLKFFTQLILIPLLLIYVVILYIYALKILINWELPRGWVSYLVLIYAVLGQLALLLVHPLKEGQSKSWVRIFSQLFYYTLIPLLVLLYTALFTRILEYGYTEPRYFLLMLSLWLTSVVGYFCLKPSGSIKFIPMSLFAFGVFSIAVPYFNAFSIAKRSQKSELALELSKASVLDSGTIQFDRPITDKQMQSIADKFEFLAVRGEWDYLEKFLPEAQKTEFEQSVTKFNYWKLNTLLRSAFTRVSPTKSKNDVGSFSLSPRPELVKVEGMEYVYSYKGPGARTLDLETHQLKIEAESYGSEPHLTFSLLDGGKVVDSKELMPQISTLIKPYITREGPIETGPLLTRFTLENYTIEVHFNQLFVNSFQGSKSKWQIDPAEFLVLVHKN